MIFMELDLKMIFAIVDLYRNAKATYQGLKKDKTPKYNPRSYPMRQRRNNPPRQRSIWI